MLRQTFLSSPRRIAVSALYTTVYHPGAGDGTYATMVVSRAEFIAHEAVQALRESVDNVRLRKLASGGSLICPWADLNYLSPIY